MPCHDANHWEVPVELNRVLEFCARCSQRRPCHECFDCRDRIAAEGDPRACCSTHRLTAAQAIREVEDEEILQGLEAAAANLPPVTVFSDEDMDLIRQESDPRIDRATRLIQVANRLDGVRVLLGDVDNEYGSMVHDVSEMVTYTLRYLRDLEDHLRRDAENLMSIDPLAARGDGWPIETRTTPKVEPEPEKPRQTLWQRIGDWL